MAGAATPAELEAMLTAAGFAEVRVDVKAGSRDFIQEWIPGPKAGDFVASANLTGRKPQN